MRWPRPVDPQDPLGHGTRHLLSAPVEFLEKLAALIPRPRGNLVLDHGVLACPRCGGRLRFVATLEDPRIIRPILAHLGLCAEVP